VDSILKWLSKNGYEYTWNFKLGFKTPDLIAFKDTETIAFEFKKWARNLSDAVGQCLFYLEKVNTAYVVLPISEVSKIDGSYLKLLHRHGIGLIAVNKKIKVLIPAKFHDKDIALILDRLREKSFTRISSVLPNKNQSEETKKKILLFLEEHPEGLSISEIANLSHFHRHTITKYIHELIGEEKIHQRDLGTVKLHYLKSKLIQPVKEKEILEKLKRQIR